MQNIARITYDNLTNEKDVLYNPNIPILLKYTLTFPDDRSGCIPFSFLDLYSS